MAALDGLGPLRRTHRCREVDAALVGGEVALAGWVHKSRDHGGLVFVDLRGGEVEVEAFELRILNRATPPPFPIEEEALAEEAVRLRHRIHDLRRPPLQRALRLRHQLTQAVRRALCEQGFLEIETPI